MLLLFSLLFYRLAAVAQESEELVYSHAAKKWSSWNLSSKWYSWPLLYTPSLTGILINILFWRGNLSIQGTVWRVGTKEDGIGCPKHKPHTFVSGCSGFLSWTLPPTLTIKWYPFQISWIWPQMVWRRSLPTVIHCWALANGNHATQSTRGQHSHSFKIMFGLSHLDPLA